MSESSSQNPFDQPPILDRLFLLMSVKDVSEYRKVNQAWDTVAIQCLKKRAREGHVKAIEFIWDADSTPLPYLTNIENFFDDTEEIKGLFVQFSASVPHFLTVSNFKTLTRFEGYTIGSLYLHFQANLEMHKFMEKLLIHFLNRTSKDLRQLAFIIQPESRPTPTLLHSPKIEGVRLFFPMLRNIVLFRQDEVPASTQVARLTNDITRIIFTNGQATCPNLEWIEILSLPHGTFGGLLTPSFYANVHMIKRLDINLPSEPLTIMTLTGLTEDLVSLARAGCKLEELRLDLFTPPGLNQALVPIANNLTYFLGKQVGSLNKIHLTNSMYFNVNLELDRNGFAQIIFPILPFVEELIYIGTSVVGIQDEDDFSHVDLINIQCIPINFPALRKFTYGGDRVEQLGPNFLSGSGYEDIVFTPLNMDSLAIHVWNRMGIQNWRNLHKNFASVSSLTCPSSFLRAGRLPWADTVRELHIRGVDCFFAMYISIFTNIEELYAEEDNNGIWSPDYVEFFAGIINHNLTTITVRGYNIPSRLKDSLKVYYPHLTLKFEERELDWFLV